MKVHLDTSITLWNRDDRKSHINMHYVIAINNGLYLSKCIGVGTWGKGPRALQTYIAGCMFLYCPYNPNLLPMPIKCKDNM